MKLNTLILMLATTERGCRIARAFTGLFSLLALLAIVSMLTTWWADLKLVFFAESSQRNNLMHDFFSVIPEGHLFGIQPPASFLTVPMSTGALKLTGLVQTSQNAALISKAIIARHDEPGRIYQEGDILPGGIKLAFISADGVLLDNRGHWERLSLQRAKWEK